jgi:hypothetical protein
MHSAPAKETHWEPAKAPMVPQAAWGSLCWELARAPRWEPATTGLVHTGTRRKALARLAVRQQAAAGGAVQARVAHDHRLLARDRRVARRQDHDVPAGHALAHVVVRLAHQLYEIDTDIKLLEPV